MKIALRYTGMLLIAGLLAAFAVACDDDDSDDETSAASASPTTAAAAAPTEAPAASDASIAIVEPADGWTADAGRIDVQVDVNGLTLDGTKIGLPSSDNPGVGHWHVYVDGDYAGLSVSDVVSLPNDAMPSISAGTHEISVQLHNTDHTPLTPEVSDAVEVTLPEDLVYTNTPGDPSISIVAPEDGATMDSRVEIRVDVNGFLLDGTKIGLPAGDNPGVGHWHVYVDGDYAGLSVSDVVSLPNDAMPSISAGTHEITVQLHNTDHTPVLPEQTDTVTVTFP